MSSSVSWRVRNYRTSAGRSGERGRSLFTGDDKKRLQEGNTMSALPCQADWIWTCGYWVCLRLGWELGKVGRRKREKAIPEHTARDESMGKWLPATVITNSGWLEHTVWPVPSLSTPDSMAHRYNPPSHALSSPVSSSFTLAGQIPTLKPILSLPGARLSRLLWLELQTTLTTLGLT